jgi:16S rRNA (guanine966-N2)-methyltransferase
MRIISGNKKGHKLITKKNQSARPISDKNRETIFNLLAHGNGIVETGFSIEQCKILDVFAGTGSFSFEALSRGAKKSVMIEKDSMMIDLIYENIKKLNFLDVTEVHHIDALRVQSSDFQDKFDLVYIDPPYEKGLDIKFLNKINNINIFSENCIFIIEQSLEDKVLENDRIELIRIKELGNSRFLFFKIKQYLL